MLSAAIGNDLGSGLFRGPPTLRSVVCSMVILAGISVVVRLPGIYSRPIWHDEAISLLQAAGHPLPNWPSEIQTAGELKQRFLQGDPSLSEITHNLAATDVHPPLYWWCLSPWRIWCGDSVEAARWFSLVCSVVGVLVFFGLLLVLRWPLPRLGAAIFALSTTSIHFGHEARPYALAILLLLLAMLAAALLPQAKPRATLLLLSISCGALCGLAFLTNYLAIFPATIIVVWCVITNRGQGRWLPLGCVLPAIVITALAFPTAAAQSRTRPSFLAEPASPIAECQTALMNTLDVLCDPAMVSPKLSRLAHGLVFFLLITGILCLLEAKSRELFDGYLLFIPLVLSGAIGVIILDVLLHKHLNVVRYFGFCGPPLAALVSAGIFTVGARLKPVAASFAVVLVLIQLSCFNWGTEICPNRHDDGLSGKSLAKHLATTPEPFVVAMVTVGEGYSMALIYELDPKTKVGFVASDQDIDRFVSQIAAFEHAWLMPFDDGGEHRQLELLDSLMLRDAIAKDFRVSETFDGAIRLSRRLVGGSGG